MIYTIRLARLVVTVLILVFLVFMACRRPGTSSEVNNSDLQIALQPMLPEETLIVILTDASGNPITDATVALEGNMNHAGMLPVLAEPVTDDADGNADGRYSLPFTFTMLGDWIVTVTVTQADGSTFSRNLDVQASEEGVGGDTVVPAESPTPTPDDAQGQTTGETEQVAETHANHEHGDHQDAVSEHETVMHIHDQMARPAPLAGGTGALYFLLHNEGDKEVRLTGADSPAASAVEIHTTKNDDGVIRMRQTTEGVTIGPDESIQLTPGGMHLMLVDLASPLREGDSVKVTLHFEGADDLTFNAPVMAIDDLPADSEVAHEH